MLKSRYSNKIKPLDYTGTNSRKQIKFSKLEIPRNRPAWWRMPVNNSLESCGRGQEQQFESHLGHRARPSTKK